MTIIIALLVIIVIIQIKIHQEVKRMPTFDEFTAAFDEANSKLDTGNISLKQIVKDIAKLLKPLTVGDLTPDQEHVLLGQLQALVAKIATHADELATTDASVENEVEPDPEPEPEPDPNPNPEPNPEPTPEPFPTPEPEPSPGSGEGGEDVVTTDGDGNPVAGARSNPRRGRGRF